MFASFSTLQLIVIARFDFGQHNTRGSPVLFVCLPVGCYDNTFRWLPIFSHTLWGISSSPSIINDKNTAPQISTDYLIPSSCLQWPSSEAFASSKGRGNIIFLLFSFLVLSSPCTFRMWYRFPLEREREKERWRCWDMALKVNEVCRFCFCSPVCVCDPGISLSWFSPYLWLCGLWDILIIYISWSVRAYRSAQSIGWLKKSVVQGCSGIDLGWLSELGLYISMFLCL